MTTPLELKAENAWRDFVTKRGGPYGYSSTYENGYFDGYKQMQADSIRDAMKEASAKGAFVVDASKQPPVKIGGLNWPTKEELAKFLEIFQTLCQFEAQHRQTRNWGAFDEKDLPFPEVVAVQEWLKNIYSKRL
jgi:hypothetical protein